MKKLLKRSIIVPTILILLFWVYHINKQFILRQENYYATHWRCFEKKHNTPLSHQQIQNYQKLIRSKKYTKLPAGKYIIPITEKQLYTHSFHIKTTKNINPYKIAIFHENNQLLIPQHPSGFWYLQSTSNIDEYFIPLSQNPPPTIDSEKRFYHPFGIEKATSLNCTTQPQLQGELILLPNNNIIYQSLFNQKIKEDKTIFIVIDITRGTFDYQAKDNLLPKDFSHQFNS